MLIFYSTHIKKNIVIMDKIDEMIRLIFCKNISSETENKNSRFNLKEKLNKCEKSYNDKEFCFHQWLVGFTDGDGCFNIYINEKNNKIIFTFKIGQKANNKQVLFYIKKNLGIGRIIIDKNGMANFIVTKKNHIKDIIIPIFKSNKLLTSKEYNFILFKKCFLIYINDNLIQSKKIEQIKLIKNEKIPLNYIASNLINYKNNILDIFTKSWLIGFIEAEGSFYITKKGDNRLVHGFGITQKKDKIILDCIKLILKINANVRYNKYGFFTLDASDKKSLKFIKDFFFKTMKSRKSLIYRIWARSFRLKGKYNKLLLIQKKIRQLY